MVEHFTRNEGVTGSSPAFSTRIDVKGQCIIRKQLIYNKPFFIFGLCTIDLADVESLRKWIYMPESFTSNLNNTMYKNRLIENRFILHIIKNLYSFIEKTTGNKTDIENKHFNIGQTTLKQHEKFQKI